MKVEAKKFLEYENLKGDIVFDLFGFRDCEDFVTMTKIIKVIIKPNSIQYSGIIDMDGYFVKDGIRVEMEYDSMTGNELIYKGDRSEEKVAKVRQWAQIVFSELMRRDQEGNSLGDP
ncbi:MAG: hypothetical protein HPY50_04760 [Firmicutes bacterium]|nr:hypothetical protein [Bacillota bacterium]